MFAKFIVILFALSSNVAIHGIRRNVIFEDYGSERSGYSNLTAGGIPANRRGTSRNGLRQRRKPSNPSNTAEQASRGFDQTNVNRLVNQLASNIVSFASAEWVDPHTGHDVISNAVTDQAKEKMEEVVVALLNYIRSLICPPGMSYSTNYDMRLGQGQQLAQQIGGYAKRLHAEIMALDHRTQTSQQIEAAVNRLASVAGTTLQPIVNQALRGGLSFAFNAFPPAVKLKILYKFILAVADLQKLCLGLKMD